MKQILIIIQIDTHFVELSRVARLLKKSGKFTPLFWFNQPYATIERDLATCRSEGWEYIDPSINETGSQTGMGRIPESSLSKFFVIQYILFSKLRSIPFSGIFREPLRLIFFTIPKYIQYIRLIRHLLKSQRPSLLITAEDTISYGLNIFIKSGKNLGIPTVIVPFTIANATEPAEAFFDRPEYIVSDNLLNRLVGSRFPHWVYCHKGRELLRMPAGDIIALELLGFAPRQPWIYNSEETSTLAVENEHMFNYYLKEGLPAERLVITGALYDDVLSEGIKNAEINRAILNKELDLNPELLLLVCALPPSQFPRNCEFPDYPELLRFWMEALNGAKGWNIVIRPHPRISPEDIRFLQQFGVKITLRDTADLIALCDLYIASVSATIRWAIACGKPVLNYDVYRYNYSDYAEAEGVITIADKNSFTRELQNLTSNKNYYEETKIHQMKRMSDWGRLDGQSGVRMMGLFNDIIQKDR